MIARFRSVIALLALAILPAYGQPSRAHHLPASVCHGTPSSGSLEYGRQLPREGSNFSAYHSLGITLGRTYAHDRVAKVVGRAYRQLQQLAPGKHFVYGESGFRSGGRIRPHRSHQNGLSVDFFVPVIDASGRSRTLPSTVANKGGYAIEFDDRGRFGQLTIDYDAMAKHLLALKRAADEENIGIRVVIFDNALQPHLFSAPDGRLLKRAMRFSKLKPWIRHDEHYHVDFDVPCR